MASAAVATPASARPTLPEDAPAKPQHTPKLANVQGLRAIAVLMVVAVHVGNRFGWEPRYLGGDSLLRWVTLPGQVGVDLFFVISGLIMTITTFHHAHGVDASRRFMLRRVKRIYPIYWVVTSLVLVVYLSHPDLVNSHSAYPPQVFESYTLLPQAGLPLLAVGWTLTFEMYFYLVFAGALLVDRKRLPWLLGGWGVLTIALAILFKDSNSPALQLLTSPLLLEFVFGVGVGYLVMTRPPIAPVGLLTTGAAVIVIAVLYAEHIDPTALHPWYRVLIVGPPSAMIVLGAIGLERNRRYVAHPNLQYIGDASYSIYLWHTLVLVAAGRILQMVLPDPTALHVLLLVAIPVAAVIGCIVLYEIIERPLLTALGQRMTPRPRKATS
jgi:exopolysaccharide production protein ExoZ